MEGKGNERNEQNSLRFTAGDAYTLPLCRDGDGFDLTGDRFRCSLELEQEIPERARRKVVE